MFYAVVKLNFNYEFLGGKQLLVNNNIIRKANAKSKKKSMNLYNVRLL